MRCAKAVSGKPVGDCFAFLQTGEPHQSVTVTITATPAKLTPSTITIFVVQA